MNVKTERKDRLQRQITKTEFKNRNP